MCHKILFINSSIIITLPFSSSHFSFLSKRSSLTFNAFFIDLMDKLKIERWIPLVLILLFRLSFSWKLWDEGRKYLFQFHSWVLITHPSHLPIWPCQGRLVSTSIDVKLCWPISDYFCKKCECHPHSAIVSPHPPQRDDKRENVRFDWPMTTAPNSTRSQICNIQNSESFKV